MANKTTSKILGVALLVCGAGLAYWGYDMSGGLESKINQVFTGADTNGVMLCYIGGAAGFFAGLFLLLKR